MQSFRFSNGLTAILVEERSAPVLALQFWARAGSARDPEGGSGCAHFVEHMLFRASDAMKDGEYDRAMERHGMDPSAMTWFEYTTFYLKAPSWQLSDVLELELARWTAPIFSEALVEAESDVLLRERAYRVDNNPEGILIERLWQLAFAEHAYRRSSVGGREDLQQISAETLRSFWKQHYRPASTAVVLVGDFETQHALQLLEQSFGQIGREDAMPNELGTPLSAEQRCEPLPKSARAETVAMPIDTEMLLLGYPSPPAASRESVALKLLNEALFAPPFGLLYRELKLEKQWLAELEGWVGEFSCRSLWEIKLIMKEGVSHREVRRTVLSTISALARDGLEPALLERARKRLRLDFVVRRAELDSLAEALGQAWVTSGRASSFFEYEAVLQSVGEAELRALADDWLGASRLTELLGVPHES
jgi:zinc protease